MSLKNLKPFKEPPPVEREACKACNTFAPECLVPVGELAVPMCWLCAHHVVDHEASLSEAPTGRCDCMPHDIYPGRQPAPVAPPKPPEPNLRELEREKLLKGPPEKLAAWVREAHKQMSLSQHAALKRRLN